MSVTVGSLFSGVGGFDLGLEAAGFEVRWQVENDRWCREVLRARWPNVDLYEDVKDVGADLASVDLICGGFPCQDLSVAGGRAGLAGDRSGLFYEFMRVVGEIAPRWVFIENVPGLLSSNGGRDMGAVVGTLAELGYGWTYRVLDTQHFGPPQRRERVFIVGRAGGFCPPEVLLEPESVPGHPAKGGAAWEVAPTIPASGAGTSRPGGPGLGSEEQYVVPGRGVTETLRVGGREQGAGNSYDNTPWTIGLGSDPLYARDLAQPVTGRNADPGAVAFSVNQRREARLRDVHGCLAEPSGTQVDGVLTPTGEKSHTLRGRGCDASEDGTGRGTPVIDTAVPRRLTPRECERLQGFPDDWTASGVDADGEPTEISDTQRYKQMGNAVSVPVAAWIGARIVAVDSGARLEAA